MLSLREGARASFVIDNTMMGTAGIARNTSKSDIRHTSMSIYYITINQDGELSSFNHTFLLNLGKLVLFLQRMFHS